MNKLQLTLRQRKLLHIMQEQTTYITGTDLARQLGVSPRTIRSDVVEINDSLKPYEAKILSERSKGYLYEAKDPTLIQRLNQIEAAFFTKEDRLRYLAFQLCLSEEPLNLYDLEDEMFVSHTTLEHDLRSLKRKYVQGEPHILLIQERNQISFEQNEGKIRKILTYLFHEDWNYNTKGNSYYSYEFLDEDILNHIMDETSVILYENGISIEDPSLVFLNLSIVIMYHRNQTGHYLPDMPPMVQEDSKASSACLSIFKLLEDYLSCHFSQTEQDAVYAQIATAHLMDASLLNFQTIDRYLSPKTLMVTNTYLRLIDTVFGIDFSGDEDFFITLAIFLRNLQYEDYIYYLQGNLSLAKKQLIDEYEFACIFQRLSSAYLDRHLNEIELINLSQCIHGALEFLYVHHPEMKLRTVLCSNQNMPSMWDLKQKILGAFGNYLNVTHLIPVNARKALDFDNVDLVITTSHKQIIDSEIADTLLVSFFMDSSDMLRISQYINEKRLEHLCTSPSHSLQELFDTGYWHESALLDTRFAIMETMASEFIKDGIATEEFLAYLLRREAISSFAIQFGLVFLPAQTPAAETKLSFLLLRHKITWNNFRIRLIIMGAFTPEDITLIFHLNHAFYLNDYSAESINQLRTRGDLYRLFDLNPPE